MKPESRSSRIARAVVGGLLVAESLAMLVAALFAVVGSLSGVLALGGFAGGAKEAVVGHGIGVVVLATLTPFVVTVALGVGGALLLLRRRRGVIVAAGLLALAVQIAFHVFVEGVFHAAELVPCAVHVAAVVVGFTCVPPAHR